MEDHLITLLTKCLWEYQEMTPQVEGVMLVATSGFIVASTFSMSDEISRLAAVSSALFLLGRQFTHEFELGKLGEIGVRYTNEDGEPRDAELLPVNPNYFLVVAIERVSAVSLPMVTVPFNTQQMTYFVARLLDGDDPPPIQWM